MTLLKHILNKNFNSQTIIFVHSSLCDSIKVKRVIKIKFSDLKDVHQDEILKRNKLLILIKIFLHLLNTESLKHT